MIVALGASAGGLRALTAFFDGVEEAGDTLPAAFIVVVHLSPDQKSRMAEILQSRLSIPVEEVDAPMPIERGRVYVVPADRSLTVADGRVEPRPRSHDVPPHPVDDLFNALAPNYGPRAVGAVLSGTGSNGSHGIGPIKENGGLVLAQAPDTADFSDMPRHAIETGLVDDVLPPADMAEVIAAYARHMLQADSDETAARDDPEPAGTASHATAGSATDAPAAPSTTDARRQDRERAFPTILNIVRHHTGLDLRQYKVGTLQRRIERRIALHRLPDWGAYVTLVRGSAEEREALVSDLLITVTSFFRDEAAWESLRECVVRPLVARADEDTPLRAWVPGCASGEEAYSLAILMLEEIAAQDRTVSVEIFATDVSLPALARARQGRYPAASVQAMPQQRRERFFRREEDSVRVRHDLREAVVFAPQNIVQDPPFSRVDLIVCRNVLIYLKADVQQKVLRLFQFALNEGGNLFLGPAENIAPVENLFDTLSSHDRIYRQKPGVRRDPLDLPIVPGQTVRPPMEPLRQAGLGEQPTGRRASIAEHALHALSSIYAPPSVVVNDDLHVIYYHGRVDRYLKPQSGEPTQDIGILLREGLSLRVRHLAGQARETGEARTGLARTTIDGDILRVRVEVTPLEQDVGGSFLVSFIEEGEMTEAPDGTVQLSVDTSRERELEAEVQQLRDDLRRTLQSSQRNQEELKSYNEEIMSMNEELRSANEELETSKEELQSLNEELNTVNAQLRAKVDELHERTSDLNNILTSTDIATVFLDSQLHIRWFSPGMADLFNIRDPDAGRPISDLTGQVEDATLVDDARDVIRRLVPAERQVKAEDGRSFQRRIVPYRTLDDRIDGVVVTFTDVTALRTALDYAERIVETVPLPFLVLDENLRIASANPAFYQTFRVDPAETEHRLVYDLGNGQWNIPELRRLLSEVLPEDEVFAGLEVRHTFDTVGFKIMKLNARRLDHVQLILLAIEDVTDERRASADLQASEERLRSLVHATNFVVYRMSPDWSQMWELDGRGFLADPGEPTEGWMDRYIHPDDQEDVRARIEEAIRTRSMFESEHRVRRPDGSLGWSRSRAVPLLDERGAIREWFGAASDVTPRKQAEEDRELLVGELNHRVKNVFAVVRALASQAEVSRSAAEFRDTFLSRLTALARAHDLALGADWQGSDLATLAASVVDAYQDGGGSRIAVDGEALPLDPRQTVTLSLVLHELATNAAKHGGLSRPEGTVHLSWRARGEGEGRKVALEWRERGGPPVTPPERKSFGLRMLERIVAFDLGGEASFDFQPEGLVFTATFPP